MASNRRSTKKQFSDGTTIDGSEIDYAIDEVVDYQNEIPSGYTEGRLTKTDYVGHWSPARSFYSTVAEASAGNLDGLTPGTAIGAQDRTSPAYYGACFEHFFPFMVCRNWLDETYPLANTVVQTPTPEFQNEYRHKGFVDSEEDLEHDRFTRSMNIGFPTWLEPTAAIAASLDATITNTMGNMYQQSAAGGFFRAEQSTLNEKYMAVTFSYFFDKPVVLSALSVVANQEHPISYFTMGDPGGGTFYQINQPGGEDYKYNVAAATQWDNLQDGTNGFRTTTAAKFIETNTAAYSEIEKTGNTFFGSEQAPCYDNMTIQVSIEDTHVLEKRNLDALAFNVMGGKAGQAAGTGIPPRSRWEFNRLHTTSNTSTNAVAAGTCGGQYVDMVPPYPGGPTWGRWMMEQDLNIPIPAGSKVKFAVICKGHLSTLAHEWNTCLTVLEALEE